MLCCSCMGKAQCEQCLCMLSVLYSLGLCERYCFAECCQPPLGRPSSVSNIYAVILWREFCVKDVRFAECCQPPLGRPSSVSNTYALSYTVEGVWCERYSVLLNFITIIYH